MQQSIKSFNQVVVKSDIFEFPADEIETSGQDAQICGNH
jgi:hypothetical protein